MNHPSNEQHPIKLTATNPKFELGRLVITKGLDKTLRDNGELHVIGDFVTRHMQGDWGDLDEEDRKVNEQAIECEARIFSVYDTPKGTTLWIITEAVGPSGERETTTLLLPEEY